MKWPTAQLGAVTKIVSGSTPKSGKPAFWGGSIPWATPTDLSGLTTKELTSTGRQITEAGFASCSANMLPARSVLFSSRAPIGLVAINKQPLCTNQGFKSFVPDACRLSPDFLYWWLKGNRPALEHLGRGATFKEVSKSIIEKVEIPLPPLAEQKRIAAILDAADALRTKRREALAQLDALLHSTFLTLFGDPVANPMKWKVVLLGKTANRITKGQSPNWQGFNYQDSGALFVTSENVREGHLDISRPKFVPLEFNQKLKSSQLMVGDLLINLVGASIGRSCLFTGYLGPANVNQAVGIVSIDDPVLTNYIVHLLQTPQGQTLLTGRIVEAARANVSLANLRELPIPLPPLPLQQKFAAIVESVERQKAAQRGHLAELDALFAALQHRAFCGEL